MSFRWFVYYCSLCGGCAAYFGWVFGRVPDPVDRPEALAGPLSTRRSEAGLEVDWYDGDRGRLRALFEEAEDSPAELDAYLDEGRVLVARLGEGIVGHLQLVETGHEGVLELKNMAVAESWRGTGIGRRLVEHALTVSADEGFHRMLVATAAASAGNLRFYQRCGFRLLAIERDAFTPASGYEQPIAIDGVPLRDRVWLDQVLTAT